MLRLAFLAAFALGAAAGPQVGKPAPGFRLSGLQNGREVSLASLSGKVVLVDFWASWCTPCRRTLPELARLRARHPNLVVLAVSIDEERSKAVKFLKGMDTNLVTLHDAKRVVAEAYALGGMPSAVLIDRKGVLRKRFDGYTEREMPTLEKQADDLLKEGK